MIAYNKTDLYLIIVKITTTNTGAVVTGILTATSFVGDGSGLTNLPVVEVMVVMLTLILIDECIFWRY